MTEALDTPRPLHCVFYSHVWAIHMLKHAGLGKFDKSVVIELAAASNFAPVLGLQGKARFGLGGLLRLGARLEQLGQEVKYVPAPLVLAPNPPLPVAALCSAAAMLPHATSEYEKAVLLVNIHEAVEFADTYAYMSEFTVLWDIADEPGPGLGRLAEALADSQCLDPQRWRGFKLYRHPNRALPDADQRQAALQSVLDEYPLLGGRS